MQTPYVHINGTSAESLKRQYMEAWEAVNNAVEALVKCEVHDRDYYPINNDAGPVARQEHRERIAKLESIKTDLETIILSIQSQV